MISSVVPTIQNGKDSKKSNSSFLSGLNKPLLLECEIKSASDKNTANKPSVLSILRDWAKDENFDNDLNVVTSSNGIDKNSFISKLKTVTRVKNIPLLVRILERIEVLQKNIPNLSYREASKTKQQIFKMKEVVFKLSRCGNSLLPGKELEIVSTGKNNRAVNNVVYCNRAVCPGCSSFIARERIALLTPVLEKIVREDSYNLFFITISIRHRRGTKFKVLKNVMSTIWNSMLDVRWFKDNCAGFIKNAECTETVNGIHYHYHAVIALCKSIDPEWFANKMENYWESKSRKLNRSCDWSKQNGQWFKPLRKEELGTVVKYFVDYQEPKQLKEYSILNEVLSSDQKGSNLWNISPESFCEVYLDSKNMRWFASGGIFKQKILEVENENIVARGTSATGIDKEKIFSISRELWKGLDFPDKYIIRDLVANKLIDDNQCVLKIKEIIKKMIYMDDLF